MPITNQFDCGHRELLCDNWSMKLLPAGMFGLGLPEVMALLIPTLLVVLIMRIVRRPTAPSRYCAKCGRGLTQPLDAPFCSYCGNKLP